MALHHAGAGQALDVRPLGDRFPTGKTSALFKAEHLEVVRLVLPAGKAIASHRVSGEITIQCLEGGLEVELETETLRLEAGMLVFLAAGAAHGVRALTDASALVTIALKPHSMTER